MDRTWPRPNRTGSFTRSQWAELGNDVIYSKITLTEAQLLNLNKFHTTPPPTKENAQTPREVCYPFRPCPNHQKWTGPQICESVTDSTRTASEPKPRAPTERKNPVEVLFPTGIKQIRRERERSRCK